MISKILWEAFKEIFNEKQCFYNRFENSNSKVAWYLVITIFLTPVTIILDILTLPMQILYFICLKIVRMIRRSL